MVCIPCSAHDVVKQGGSHQDASDCGKEGLWGPFTSMQNHYDDIKSCPKPLGTVSRKLVEQRHNVFCRQMVHAATIGKGRALPGLHITCFKKRYNKIYVFRCQSPGYDHRYGIRLKLLRFQGFAYTG